MKRSTEERLAIIDAFKKGVKAKDIAVMYGMKRENVYSLLKVYLSRDEYNTITVSRRASYDNSLKERRDEILVLLASGVSLAEIAQRFGVTEHSIKYHYYRYVKPSDRKRFLARRDAKNEQKRLKKVAYIKSLIERLKEAKSVELLASYEDKKSNTMWVYLRRNRKIIESLVGMNYDDFLTSVRGYSHEADVESVLEGFVKAHEANNKR